MKARRNYRMNFTQHSVFALYAKATIKNIINSNSFRNS